MSSLPYIEYECAPSDFRPYGGDPVRWLAEADYPLVRAVWPAAAPWPATTPESWLAAQALGFQYAAVILGGQIQALAAALRCPGPVGEVWQVYTRPEARGRGYAKAVVSFVTAAILDAGQRARCSTAHDNHAMQRVAESLGFQRVKRAS
ncbi:MAG: GNAT family N-acetyltransferase [Anaerolineae bacterium]|nr:GNAT family N-acetyltransferase [Anaerolineae bacterium]